MAWPVIGPRLYRRRVALGRMDSATGRTTPCSPGGTRSPTGLRPLGLAVAPAVIHLPNARPAPGTNRRQGGKLTSKLPRVVA